MSPFVWLLGIQDPLSTLAAPVTFDKREKVTRVCVCVLCAFCVREHLFSFFFKDGSMERRTQTQWSFSALICPRSLQMCQTGIHVQITGVSVPV